MKLDSQGARSPMRESGPAPLRPQAGQSGEQKNNSRLSWWGQALQALPPLRLWLSWATTSRPSAFRTAPACAQHCRSGRHQMRPRTTLATGTASGASFTTRSRAATFERREANVSPGADQQSDHRPVCGPGRSLCKRVRAAFSPTAPSRGSGVQDLLCQRPDRPAATPGRVSCHDATGLCRESQDVSPP